MKINKSAILIGVLILALVLLVVGLLNRLTSLKNLPKGEYEDEYPSPNGLYSIHVYVNRPSLSKDWARGELVNNRTGKRKNIYWAPLIYNEASIKWLDEENVVIDDIKLNVLKDQYDYRWPPLQLITE